MNDTRIRAWYDTTGIFNEDHKLSWDPAMIVEFLYGSNGVFAICYREDTGTFFTTKLGCLRIR